MNLDPSRRSDEPMSRMLMPPKKVVVATIAPWFETLSGALFLGLFRDLSTLGCHVTAVLPSSRRTKISEGSFSVIGLKVRRYVPVLTLFSLYRLAVETAVREKCSTFIFDFRMLPVFLVCKILLKSKGVCLTTSRPVGVAGFRGWLRFLYFHASLLVGRSIVETFTAVSPFEARTFSRLGRIQWRKMLVVPSPLGQSFVRFAWQVDPDDSRSRLGYNDLLGKNVLLYHGVFHEQRDIMRVLGVFIESFRDNDNMVLLLVGSGPARDSIESLVQREASNVLLWDPVAYSKLPEIIACCNIGVVWLPDHPWWRYQCPTKLIELLAMGKPVVASDLPGVRWIAGESPLVVYLRKLDVSSFTKAVKKAATAKDVLSCREQVRQDMIDRFSTKSIASQLWQLIY